MSDPDVDRWRQRGRVCVWKERGRHPDWNLAADDVACAALAELFDLMRQAKWPSRKLIALAPPEPGPTGRRKPSAKYPRRLMMNYRKALVDENYWCLEGDVSDVALTLGSSRLDELREAVVDITRGGGDYQIGGDDAPLWIWWYLP